MSTDFPCGPPDASEWITQAEAARIHGVSRQAISKLVRNGKLKTIEVGGRVFVSRQDLDRFRPGPAGRPPRDGEPRVHAILHQLRAMSEDARRAVLGQIRKEYPIHELERKLGAPAEVILEAIDLAGPLTLRGIRGVLAESAFRLGVVEELKAKGWINQPIHGDPSYDFALDDGRGVVRVQVKLQRKKADRPMRANEGSRRLSADMFVTETQRTRGGKDQKTGGDTRPYRYEEFDILAVCMEPSTGDWGQFYYTVARWLLPRPEDPNLLLKFQPVAASPNEDWTNTFETCVGWLRSGATRTIGGIAGGSS
ncbi:MAG: helix-turn-helix domain-containing protein [Isosphaeraceae bacterium]